LKGLYGNTVSTRGDNTEWNCFKVMFDKVNELDQRAAN